MRFSISKFSVLICINLASASDIASPKLNIEQPESQLLNEENTSKGTNVNSNESKNESSAARDSEEKQSIKNLEKIEEQTEEPAKACDIEYEYSDKIYVIQGIHADDRYLISEIKKIIQSSSDIEDLMERLRESFTSFRLHEEGEKVVILFHIPRIAEEILIRINADSDINRALESAVCEAGLQDIDCKSRKLAITKYLSFFNINKFIIHEDFKEIRGRAGCYKIFIRIKHEGYTKTKLQINSDSVFKSEDLMHLVPSFDKSPPNKFNTQMIVPSVTEYLKSMGYLDPKVSIVDIKYSPEQNVNLITLDIQEGQKFIVKILEFDIDEKMPRSIHQEIYQLQSVIFFSKPHLLTQKTVDLIAFDILNYLRDRNIRYCNISVHFNCLKQNDRESELKTVIKITVDPDIQKTNVLLKDPSFNIKLDASAQNLKISTGDYVSNNNIIKSSHYLIDNGKIINEDKDCLSEKQIHLEEDGTLKYSLTQPSQKFSLTKPTFEIPNLFMDQSVSYASFNSVLISKIISTYLTQNPLILPLLGNTDDFANIDNLNLAEIGHVTYLSPNHSLGGQASYSRINLTEPIGNAVISPVCIVLDDLSYFLSSLFLSRFFCPLTTSNPSTHSTKTVGTISLISDHEKTYPIYRSKCKAQFTCGLSKTYQNKDSSSNGHLRAKFNVAQSNPHQKRSMDFEVDLSALRQDHTEYMAKLKALFSKRFTKNINLRAGLKSGIKGGQENCYKFSAADLSPEYCKLLTQSNTQNDLFFHVFGDIELGSIVFGAGVFNLSPMIDLNPCKFFSLGIKYKDILIKFNVPLIHWSIENYSIYMKNLCIFYKNEPANIFHLFPLLYNLAMLVFSKSYGSILSFLY